MAEKTKDDLNIYQKLARIRKQVEVIQKNRAGYNYKYVDDVEILAKVTALMDKYHLSLIPLMVPGTFKHEAVDFVKTKYNKATKEYYDETNKEVIVQAEMNYVWVNNDDPAESITIPWGLIGQQADGSQAFGAGLTYSQRYFLLKYFNIATPEDDPDKWRSKQRAAEAAEEQAIAAQTIAHLDECIKTYLSANPKSSDDVKKLVSKYVKNGNYFQIADPTLANKLLSDFQTNFMKEVQ